MQTIVTPEIRKRAAELLLERGWCQHVFRQFDTSKICMTSAIRLAAGAESGTPISVIDDNETNTLLGCFGFKTIGDACRWNNEADRTIDEVIDRIMTGAPVVPA